MALTTHLVSEADLDTIENGARTARPAVSADLAPLRLVQQSPEILCGGDVLLIILLISAAIAAADESPLSLADLAAYRVALGSKPDRSAPLVRFRELWDHPEAHAGHSVQIEGRVARFFRQPRVGEFPPLVEAWVVSSAGDPFCLVFPQPAGGAVPELGVSVRFFGTFLRKIEYHGADVSRLAPLIVGSEPPVSSTGPTGWSRRSWSSIDWLIGLGAAAGVGLVLLRRHFSRPVSLSRDREPDPVFLDGEPDSYPDQKGSRDEDQE